MADQKMKQYAGMMCTDLPADMLEEVVTQLPTMDLLSASCVSNEWLHAVRSSLHRKPRVFPWLVLCCFRHPKPSSSYSMHALDPYSRTWLTITSCQNPVSNSIGQRQLPMTPYFLRSSTRDRLYTLSLSKMAIFRDPFGSTTCQMEANGPKLWRQDPVGAEVGRWIVMAGGGFMTDVYEGEEEGAVEVYDKQTGIWESADAMPMQFDGSTYARWLSVAVSDKRLYVIEKKTGWMSQFDPESKKWGPTSQLRPDKSMSAWALGIVGKERLLLVGAGREGSGERKGAMKVRVWEVEGDTLRVIDNKSEEMPTEMVDGLFPNNYERLGDARERACSVAVEVHGTERGGYIFDPSNMKNGVVMYQLSVEGREGRMVRRWEWVPCPASVGDIPMEGISAGCSPVSLSEIARYFV